VLPASLRHPVKDSVLRACRRGWASRHLQGSSLTLNLIHAVNAVAWDDQANRVPHPTKPPPLLHGGPGTGHTLHFSQLSPYSGARTALSRASPPKGSPLGPGLKPTCGWRRLPWSGYHPLENKHYCTSEWEWLLFPNEGVGNGIFVLIETPKSKPNDVHYSQMSRRHRHQRLGFPSDWWWWWGGGGVMGQGQGQSQSPGIPRTRGSSEG
jgi:hypothetical protein